jgi:sugar transferase (PEP-CTERM system associated)
MAVLAALQLVIFAVALYIASLLPLDSRAARAALPPEELMPRALLFASVTSVAMAAMGLYSARQLLTPTGLLTRIVAAAAGATVILTLFTAVPPLGIGRSVLLTAFAMVVAAAFASHTLVERIASENTFKRGVLVYGAGRLAASLAQLPTRGGRRAFNIRGYVPTLGDEPNAVLTERKVEVRTTLLEYCKANNIVEVVMAMDDVSEFPFEAVLECRLAGVGVTDLTSFMERETGKVRIDLVHPSWMIFSDGFSRTSLQSHIERAVDLLASLTLLIVSWPVMLATMVAIKLEEGLDAPVLYRQTRVGQYGKHFQLLKFRSMRVDAERGGRARWAAANDDRVTAVGRIIRKLRIDELPQLLNVLLGQMSLVGPRPERPEFVSQLRARIPLYGERHMVKPGITGWAQLCYPYGSNEADAAEKLQYDLFYVKNRTLLFYMAILVQTVEVILWGKGAR